MPSTRKPGTADRVNLRGRTATSGPSPLAYVPLRGGLNGNLTAFKRLSVHSVRRLAGVLSRHLVASAFGINRKYGHFMHVRGSSVGQYTGSTNEIPPTCQAMGNIPEASTRGDLSAGQFIGRVVAASSCGWSANPPGQLCRSRPSIKRQVRAFTR